VLGSSLEVRKFESRGNQGWLACKCLTCEVMKRKSKSMLARELDESYARWWKG
jgi:hypothetical protein